MKKSILLSTLIIGSLVLIHCKKPLANKDEQEENTFVFKKPQGALESSHEVVFDPTYAHVVYFWFKDPTDIDGRALFEKSLLTFLDRSKYAKTHFIGTPPDATRKVVDDSFTYNLILSFASAQDQEAYQSESSHKVFIKECSHLWDKVIVYDANAIR